VSADGDDMADVRVMTRVQKAVTSSGALRVIDKTVVADGVVTLTLADPDGGRLPDWTPGAHIDLVLPTGHTRQYSLCGDRFDSTKYQVSVLRENDSRGGSAYVHDGLNVGDMVGVGGPRNNFGLVPSKRYLFVAGGIGITPILPMLDQAERVGADWQLLYGGRRRASMAFVDRLARYGDRVVVRPQDEFGMLDLPAFLGRPDPTTKIYGCGPAPLLDAVTVACTEWPRYALRTERFVAQDSPLAVRTASFDVELRRSGRTVTVWPQMSVLDAVETVGVEVLSSCRQGTCGTCESTVLAGVPEHRDSILDDAERAAGDCMFICVSRAVSDRLVLDL